MADAYTIINGAAYGHNNHEARLNQKVRRFITEIEYDHELENGEQRGNGPLQLSDVDGDYKPSLKVTMAMGQAQEIIDELGDGYMQKWWPFTLSFAREGLKLININFGRVKIKKESDSSKSGNEGLNTTWELQLYYIIKNGKKPVKGIVEG